MEGLSTAYEFKRSQRIQHEIKIGNEIVSVDLNADSISKEFMKRYNDLIIAESELKKMNFANNPEKLNEAMEVYGNAVVELFGLIFGEDGTEKILKFYENNYIEMSVEVFPFLINVIIPDIKNSIAEQREKIAGQYRQKSFFGMNRAARRKK